MGRNSKMAVAAILALTIAGCSGDGGTQSSDPNATNPTPAETPAVQSTPSQTQAFNNPVVAPKQVTTSTVPTSAANLIQPTNPTERVGVVTRGRPDPFAQIVSSPVPVPVTTPSSERPVPVVPPLPTARRRTIIPSTSAAMLRPAQRSRVSAAGSDEFRRRSLANQQRSNANKLALARKNRNSQRIAVRPIPPRASIPVIPSKMPPVVRTPDLAPLAPPPPQPDMARAVVVTGIVQVGSAPQAIIRVPNEPTSRYVQAGQRLANGVLVKRIEMNDGSDPIVILEQYGIEVARMVGEGSRNVGQPTAASGNPVSMATPI
ncbi:MAG: hypothetical protein KME64_43065 [Scytonematopsis contorta HA4267-MV1]|jgi:hypothetical protein|nr:hypothetical protein [Scytonematopsis contorta HA4267-MV1]